MLKRFLVVLGAIAVTAIGWGQDEIDPKGFSKPWMRLKWFYDQRAYPNQDVQPGGWQQAWEHTQDMPFWSPGGVAAQGTNDWEQFGPTSTNQNWLARVHGIAINPVNPSIMYLAIAKGGLWKTTDGGTTWANLTDALSSQVSGCVALDPWDPNIIYYGTGEEYYAGGTLSGVGIWRSTNGGATWTLYGNSTFAGQRINEIVINNANPSKWHVSTDWGIYVTTNNGASFTRVLVGVGSALLRDPSSSSVYYAALGWPFGGDPPNGVYKSVDGGITWFLQSTGLPTGTSAGRIELTICTSNQLVLYAAIASPTNYFPTVYKTTNGGNTWAPTAAVSTAGYAQGWYDLCIRVHPTNPDLVFCGEVRLSRSTNGGASWSNVTPDHTDMQALEFHPTSPGTIYLGGDFGLYRSTNQFTNYTKLNTGRGTMEFYAFDHHPTDAGKLSAGAQDNATQNRNGSNNYTVVIGGDGFWTAYHRTNPLIMLGEVYYGQIYRSTNGGGSYSGVANLSGDNAPWSTVIINDPTNHSNFYAGARRLYKSSNSGQNWAQTSGMINSGQVISAIAVAPNNGARIYTGFEDGRVFVSDNTGASWTGASNGLPLRTVTGIAVDPNDAAVAWASVSGTGGGHVYKTTNSGTTWTNVSGNLPDVPANTIEINPLDTTQVFVGTDIAPFTTTNGGASWSKFGNGFPTTVITVMKANAVTKFLQCSTYGRGMWRIPLPFKISVSGTVNLESASNASAQPLTLVLREPGTQTVVHTSNLNVGNGGAFNISNITSGIYDVSLKGRKYLRKTLLNVNGSAGNISGLVLNLKVGDIDDDNAVTLLDYDKFSVSYDKTSGDADWNAADGDGVRPKDSDLDLDGAVTLLDYDYFSANFDLSGDA